MLKVLESPFSAFYQDRYVPINFQQAGLFLD